MGRHTRLFLPLAAVFLLGVRAGTAQEETPLRLRPAVPECPVCAIWIKYEDVILKADQEVGPLKNGVIYFYHAKDPAIIQRLILFARERTALQELIASEPGMVASLGVECRHREYAQLPIDMEISIGARGFFVILTSNDSNTVEKIRADAQRAVTKKIPVWF
jgi:hypothetical protein